MLSIWLKSKKLKIMSDFKLEIVDRFNLFFIFDCCKQSLTRLLHPPIHPPIHPSIHPSTTVYFLGENRALTYYSLFNLNSLKIFDSIFLTQNFNAINQHFHFNLYLSGKFTFFCNNQNFIFFYKIDPH